MRIVTTLWLVIQCRNDSFESLTNLKQILLQTSTDTMAEHLYFATQYICHLHFINWPT